MKRVAWSRWLRTLLSQHPNITARRPKARRLRLEDLEDRLAPATATWDGGGTTNFWNEAANWVNDVGPAAGDDLVFPTGVAKLTAQNNFESVAFNSISFSGSGYTLSGNSIILGSAAGNTGFIVANLGSTNNTISLDVTMGGVAGNRQFFTVGTSNAVLTISGKLVGAGGVELSKDGPGTLILTNDNSGFNGPISITQGALRIRHKDALGDISSPTTVLDTFAGSGQLQIDTVTGGIGEPLRLNGPGPLSDGALLNVAGDNFYNGTILLDSNTTIGANAGSLVLNGVISDSGAGQNLTKEGPATIVLDPLNTPNGNAYRGQTFVNAGILAIRHSLALGNDPTPVTDPLLGLLNNTVVGSFPNRSGTLQLDFTVSAARIDPNVNATNDGFTIPFEALTLNGPGIEGIHFFPKQSIANGGGTVTGALNNFRGLNTWVQDISLWSGDSAVNGDFQFWAIQNLIPLSPPALPTVGIGAEAGTTLIIAGHINDDNLSGSSTIANQDYSLIKTRAGRVVLINANSYRGRTEILQGYLNIRDSQALGAATNSPSNGTWVFPQATLELEADQIPDSQAPFADPPHALPHLTTDIVISQEQLRPMGDGVNGDGSIRNVRGVNELIGNLLITRRIPRGNVQFNDLGTSIGVEPDYAPFLPFDRSQLTVSGVIQDDNQVGPSNLTKFGGGELVLTNANTYTGVTFIRQGWITARNSRALGQDFTTRADTQQPETYIAQGAALHLKETREVAPQPITMFERLIVSGDGIDHRFPELSHRGAILNLSNRNTITGILTLVATTAFPRVGLGVDIDSTDTSVAVSELTFTNLIQQGTTNLANPGTVTPVAIAGINKLGRKRIYLQGQGTFSGDNVVVEGVLRVQTNTALGHLSGTTTVNAGAAIELAPYVAALNGGVTNGIQMRESLALSGGGNVTADDPSHDYTSPVQIDTLTNVGSDNIWNGTITLLTDVNIDTRTNSRLGLWKPVVGPGGFTKNSLGKLVLGGNNTYQGRTFITSGTVNLQSGTALGSTLGDTVISSNASIELQGDITVAGEALSIIGNGPDAAPNITPTWFAQGPGPISNNTVAGATTTGGRLSSVAVDPFDPNVIYAAGADGGLWRTKNNGFTWESLLNNPAGLGAAAAHNILFTGAIAIAPTNSNVIYIATGEANNSIDSFYGTGVMVSTDYGLTWNFVAPPTPGLFDRHSISQIVVDPVNSDVFYMTVLGNAANGAAATAGAGLWRFDGRPGGTGWVNLMVGVIPSGGQTTAFTTAQRYTDVVVINSNPRRTDPNDLSRPNQPNRRIVYVTVADHTGGNGPSSTFAWNDVGNDVLGGVGPAGPNATPTVWNNIGFPTGTETITGRSGVVYLLQPQYGTVKVDAQRTRDVITAYAVGSFPTSAPRIDQGTDGRFRTIFTGAFTWDRNTNTWTGGGLGAMGTQPPSVATGTAANSVFGEQGWYTSTVSVQQNGPANDSPWPFPNAASYVFLGGPGGPGTADGPWVWNGTAWTDVNQAAGQGPHVNFHSATWDSTGRLIVGNDGGIWRLEGSTPPTGTPSWTNLNGNFLQLGQATGLDVHPFLAFSAVAGFNMNGTALWNDSYTWAQTDGGQGGTVYINNKNPNVIFHAQDGNLRRSTDAGLTWTTIVSGIALPRINQTPIGPPQVPGNVVTYPNTVLQNPAFPRTIDLSFSFVLDRVNTSRLLYGSGGALFESTNSDGASPTFQRLNPNTPFGSFIREIAVADRQGAWQPDPDFPLAVDIGAESYNPDTIYVLAADGGVWVTKNRGQAWFNRNNGLPAGVNTYSDLTVDPRNRDVAYVTVNAFGGGKVFRTTDGGQNWVNITSNLPDSPAWTVRVNPRSGDVFIGNDLGVYVLPGGVGNWNRFGAGLPQVQVRQIVINTVTNTITVGTYGRGVFQAQLDDSRADGGVIRGVTGSSVWTGAVSVVGGVDIRAEVGAQVNFLGSITDPASGAFTVNKLGLGKVIFSAANSYNGVTNVIEGQLVIRNPFALGASGDAARTVVFSGAALELQSNLAQETVELNGNGTQFNGHFTGALRNISNDNVFTGKLILNTPAQGPVNNAPLPSDSAPQITIGVDSGSTLTIGQDTSASPIPGIGTIVDAGVPRLLVKELTGRLILNSANTFAGLMQVNQGPLQIAHNSALGTAAAGTIVRNGAQLELTRDTSGAAITVTGESLILSGTGINATGALENLAGSNTWAGDVFLRLVTALPSPPPTTPPNKASINVVNAADTLTISGIISEADPFAPPPPPAPPTPPSMGLDKIGLGRLALTNDNTYSGTTNILAGVLSAQAANALGTAGTLGTGNGTVVSDGAALELFSTTGITYDVEEVTLNGKGVAPANLGSLRNVSGNNTWTGNVILNSTVSPASATPNPQVFIGADAGSQLNITGGNLVRDPNTVPATAKAAELHKVGPGTVSFFNANIYAGLTVVEAGVLNIRNNTSLGALLNDVQTINVTGLGGTFELTFNGQSTGNLAAAITAADLTTALEGLSTIGATNVIVTRNGNFIVVSFINALGGANQNPLSGTGAAGTTIAIATVQNGGPSAGTVVLTGATLQVQGGITVSDEPLTLNGAGVNNAGALENANTGALNNNTWSSGITLGSDAFIGVSGAGDRLTIDETIAQASANLGVTKVGPGTLEYAGGAGTGNTYTGLTKVNDGTLALNKTGGAVAVNGNLTVGDTVGAADSAIALLLQANQILDSATVRVESDGLFDLNGLAETVATLRVLDGDVFTRANGDLTVGTLDMAGGRVTVGSGGELILNGNVTATSSALETATIEGAGLVNLNGATRDFTVTDGPQLVDLRVDSVISGPGVGLNKRGNGLMELETVAAYSGDTTIFGGDLRVDGQVGHVDLEGGTLSGEGVVGDVDGGNVTVPAVGTVSPGDSDPGILRTGTNVWGPDSAFRVELNDKTTPGVGFDQLQVTGNIELGGAFLEGLTGPGVAIGDSFTIITATGLVTGQFEQGGVVFIDGKKYTIQYNDQSVVITRIKAEVVMQLASSSNPSVYGQPVTFTITVTPEPGAGPLPGPDTVTFTLDGIGVPDKTLVSGQAVLDPVADLGIVLSVGSHDARVRFNGDADFNAQLKILDPLQLVNRAPTSITVMLNPATPVFGQTVIVNVRIAATPPGGTAIGASVPTGVVTFIVDGGAPQSFPINAAGDVQLVLNGLTTGQHVIKASYVGDVNYLPIAPSQDLVVNIIRANTNVLVTAQPPSAPLGESVRFTALVTAAPPGAGSPTGLVAFYDVVAGVNHLLGQGFVNPVTGLVSIDTAVLSVGMHNIIAHYVGDTNFNQQVGALNYTVGAATTATTLTMAPNPSVFGQAVQFTATVRSVLPGNGIPTGTVTFLVDGIPLPAVAVDPTGVARISTNSLAVGNRTITARFDGNANFALSSDARTAVVVKAATAVGLVSALNPAAAGQPVTFNAFVGALQPGGGIPNGAVTFFVNGAPRGAAPVINGVASLPIAFAAQGAYNVTASYGGSANFLASNSGVLRQSVVAFASRVNLTRSVPSSVFGQPVTFTAVVRGGPFGAPLSQIPAGTVTFIVDGVARAPIALNVNGLARLALNLGIGTHNVIARFNGSATYATANMALQHTVSKANTGIQIMSNHVPAVVGQSVVVTARVVTLAPGGGVPRGTVTFVVDNVAQTPLPLNAQGTVSLNLGALPLGPHTVTATYTGSPSYNGVDSGVFVQNVVNPPPASRLTAVLTSPAAVGSAFGIRVVARDQFNNPVGDFNFSATLTVLSAPVGGTLTGPRNAGFGNGVANFNGMGVTRAGRYVVRFTAGGLFVDLVINAQGRLV